jgi:D-sedoheptulose 7-phosphate isomerase
MKNKIVEYMLETRSVVDAIIHNKEVLENIENAARIMIVALRDGKKLISCGNGGSMCDAMHFASELTGRYKETRDPIAAFALSDVAAMSCITNDFGYPEVFSRQVFALGNMGDVLLAISTSGRSENVRRAMATANSKGMLVIGLTGMGSGSSFTDQCEYVIEVPSKITNHIQEAHIKIIHILVELIEKSL